MGRFRSITQTRVEDIFVVLVLELGVFGGRGSLSPITSELP